MIGAVWGFVRRRGWWFWVPAALMVLAICLFASFYVQDQKAERTARQLAARPVAVADDVLWHVVDGYIEDVAVVLRTETEQSFTVDLTGVDGSEEVSAYDGWQPAHDAAGADHYTPGMSIRYDLTRRPPVAMAESDLAYYRDSGDSAGDLVMFGIATAALTGLVGFTVRHDLATRAPRRRSAYRSRHGR